MSNQNQDRPLDRVELRRRARALLAAGGDGVDEMAEDTISGDPEAPYSCLAYGPEGVGKSTFFSRRRGVYFLPLERGVNQIKVKQYMHPIETLPQFYGILDRLETKKHPYEAVCCDTAGALEKLIIADIDQRLKKQPVKLRDGTMARSVLELNGDFGGGYVAIADEWQEVIRRLERLKERRYMDVFLTGHAKTSTVKNIEGPDYQKYTIDLAGQRSAGVLIKWAEYVLFMRQDVSLDPSNKKKVLASTKALSIYTRQTAAWNAKTRGGVPWPERIPLDWHTFDRLRAQIAEHGADIGSWLVGRFREAAALRDASKECGERIDAYFRGSIGANQWHVADAICMVVERFRAIEHAIPSAKRPKAREVFFAYVGDGNLLSAAGLCAQAEEEAGVSRSSEGRVPEIGAAIVSVNGSGSGGGNGDDGDDEGDGGEPDGVES